MKSKDERGKRERKGLGLGLILGLEYVLGLKYVLNE